MLLIRRFEERCNYLYIRGEIPSTLHLYVGQEAVAVGVCQQLGDDDYITSTHRPHGHAIAKGVSPRSIMAELYAKSTGCCKAKGGSMHVGNMDVGMLPAIAIVGGGIPIATGMALAYKRLGTGRVAVSFFGEGAANEGAFHEALNMASLWDLPVIYVCENNLYAASTPVAVAFKVKDIAERAAAYGMSGEVVDGNDVLAVFEATGRAVERARAGLGPTLLECKTYRQVGHSRSDPLTYRTKEEEAEWAKRDPIILLADRLLADGHVTEATLEEIEREVTDVVDDAVAFAKSSPDPEPIETLQHVFFGEEV
ncbi:MAG: thiamine pyrophosphate-dependent dehydrogenase E1 component subunit alpha [Chloroflexi bacterium]|nr:thiamine pyrophosphate-dependent dehydrogenase E1 component subunit alpha [Chloroflexota bacterium]